MLVDLILGSPGELYFGKLWTFLSYSQPDYADSAMGLYNFTYGYIYYVNNLTKTIP